MIAIEDVENLLEDMMNSRNKDVYKQFKLIEEEVMNNSSIMSFAKKEEITSYITLGEIDKEDIDKLLDNMAKSLGVSNIERDVVLAMDRYFLKLILIIKWLERMSV